MNGDTNREDNMYIEVSRTWRGLEIDRGRKSAPTIEYIDVVKKWKTAGAEWSNHRYTGTRYMPGRTRVKISALSGSHEEEHDSCRYLRTDPIARYDDLLRRITAAEAEGNDINRDAMIAEIVEVFA
jgi:hypothetical protein